MLYCPDHGEIETTAALNYRGCAAEKPHSGIVATATRLKPVQLIG
jgi:hypothetical protein